ncbi:MAG: hypothetical protein IPO90_15600 [Flavobacteriales bacterium]|nr:hypothetical protein [Flavobacteriales bacterium]
MRMRSAFRSIFWFALCCLLASCGERMVRSVVFDRNGHVRALVDRVDGLEHGTFVLYSADGRVSCTGWNLYGQPVSWWHRYHPNGAIASLQHFTNGKKDGIQCYWSPQGQLLRAEKITLGLPDGPLFKFFPDGSPEQWSTFKNGKQQGRHMHWFRSNGRPAGFLQGEFLNGANHGHWIELDSAGQVNWEADFDNGRRLRK